MGSRALGWEAFLIGVVVFAVVYLIYELLRSRLASAKDIKLEKIEESVWRFDQSRLVAFLARYWKSDNDSDRQSRFELILTEYKNVGPWVYDEFFRDARYTFHLRYEHATVAGIGFDIVEDKVIVVTQIQGMKGATESLKLLKWERLLLAIVVAWARDQEYKEVRVQRAEKNIWIGHGNSRSSFKMHYDVTAKRSGFEFDKELGCFRLTLN